MPCMMRCGWGSGGGGGGGGGHSSGWRCQGGRYRRCYDNMAMTGGCCCWGVVGWAGRGWSSRVHDDDET